jgi:hypothetical protein
VPEHDDLAYGPTGVASRSETEGGFRGGNDNPAAADMPIYPEHSGTVFRRGKIRGDGLAAVVESFAPNGTRF